MGTAVVGSGRPRPGGWTSGGTSVLVTAVAGGGSRRADLRDGLAGWAVRRASRAHCPSPRSPPPPTTATATGGPMDQGRAARRLRPAARRQRPRRAVRAAARLGRRPHHDRHAGPVRRPDRAARLRLHAAPAGRAATCSTSNIGAYTDADAATKQWRTNADAEDGAHRDVPLGGAARGAGRAAAGGGADGRLRRRDAHLRAAGAAGPGPLGRGHARRPGAAGAARGVRGGRRRLPHRPPRRRRHPPPRPPRHGPCGPRHGEAGVRSGGDVAPVRCPRAAGGADRRDRVRQVDGGPPARRAWAPCSSTPTSWPARSSRRARTASPRSSRRSGRRCSAPTARWTGPRWPRSCSATRTARERLNAIVHPRVRRALRGAGRRGGTRRDRGAGRAAARRDGMARRVRRWSSSCTPTPRSGCGGSSRRAACPATTPGRGSPRRPTTTRAAPPPTCGSTTPASRADLAPPSTRCGTGGSCRSSQPARRPPGCRPGGGRLLAPDPGWAATGARLARRVARPRATRARGAAHVGPTAVPGLPAVDVLDLAARRRPGRRRRDGARPRWTTPAFPALGPDAGVAGGDAAGGLPGEREHGGADPGRPVRVHGPGPARRRGARRCCGATGCAPTRRRGRSTSGPRGCGPGGRRGAPPLRGRRPHPGGGMGRIVGLVAVVGRRGAPRARGALSGPRPVTPPDPVPDGRAGSEGMSRCATSVGARPG